MEKKDLNEGWYCYRSTDPEAAFPVTLPHDAMLLDEKNAQSRAGRNNGWYDAQDYTYEKRFFVSSGEQHDLLYLEFEGVYQHAQVCVNGHQVAYQAYGYMGFYVDITEHVRVGEDNLLTVSVRNADQPNSRWYSGTGIYRPVWL